MSRGAPRWPKEEIEKFLATESLAYQRIELPYGLATPGASREDLCDLAFALGVEGKSVLDVGSYLGYFCLEALERGATSALGLEVDPDRIRQARRLAEIRGLAPTYEQVDVEGHRFTDRYDIVLCLNILHHLTEPVSVLRRLARATRETLVLEVASFSRHDTRKFALSRSVQQTLGKVPAIYVGHGTPLTHNRHAVQKFFFSQQAILNVLQGHMQLFAKVDVIPSPFKGRFIVRATRRRIRELVVVSGPTSSGKSTFLHNLQAGTLPGEVMERLPAGAKGWSQIGANALLSNLPPRTIDGGKLEQANLEGLVLHYDFLRPWSTGCHQYARDQALDLLACADNITVVTLTPDHERLVSQLISSELGGERNPKARGRFGQIVASKGRELVPQGLEQLLLGVPGVDRLRERFRGGGASSYYKNLLEKYETPGWLETWYDRWTAYLTENHPGASVHNMQDSDGVRALEPGTGS